MEGTVLVAVTDTPAAVVLVSTDPRATCDWQCRVDLSSCHHHGLRCRIIRAVASVEEQASLIKATCPLGNASCRVLR